MNNLYYTIYHKSLIFTAVILAQVRKYHLFYNKNIIVFHYGKT